MPARQGPRAGSTSVFPKPPGHNSGKQLRSRMEKLTAKSSTIFIATSDETRVYRSVGEVPPHLRRRLEASTSGSNSATILIADKRGREELVRALQGLPSEVQSRLANTLRTTHKRQSTAGTRV